MRIGKVLILAIVVSSLCFFSIVTTSALEETETISDGTGDVVDFEGEVISEHSAIDVENIDITQATYVREDAQVTVTLEVAGEIEDRGDILDINFGGESLNIDTVGYSVMLETSEELYSITYANQECQITYSNLDTINLTSDDFSAEGNTLEISFTLETTNETYVNMSVFTQYTKFDFENYDEETPEEELLEMFVLLTDIAPNEELMVYADVTNAGITGNPIEFKGYVEPLTGTPPFTYNWDFGDGKTSSEKNPTHTYDEPGEYEYIFSVTDGTGTTESYSDLIEVVTGEDDEEDIPTELFLGVIAIIAVVGIIAVVVIIRR
jgi:PKD repeat protein